METVAGDIEETDTLTSKCRCPDVDVVTHCWNAGNLYVKESFLWSLYTVQYGVILETLVEDIREVVTLTSKCRSPDVNIVIHCLNAGILYAEESFLWSQYTVHLGDSGLRG